MGGVQFDLITGPQTNETYATIITQRLLFASPYLTELPKANNAFTSQINEIP